MPRPKAPSLPGAHQKGSLVELWDAPTAIGARPTESDVMLPIAAVAGFYLSHPQSRYFAVGKIERDQVEDYARRKGWDTATAERWLAPNLAYNP